MSQIRRISSVDIHNHLMGPDADDIRMLIIIGQVQVSLYGDGGSDVSRYFLRLTKGERSVELPTDARLDWWREKITELLSEEKSKEAASDDRCGG